MVLQHNITSANAARQYKIVTSNQAKTSERLSSGYRINRAADDCASLSISEKMRSQIRGLNRASLNASDGISLLQTAEGALNESHSITQRIRELAVQAANDSNTAEDRMALQQEINSLTTELDRIADNTEFNTMKLLDGSLAASTTSPVQSSPVISNVIVSEMQNVNGVIVSDPLIQSGSTISSAQESYMNGILSDSIVPQAVNSFLSTFPAFSSAASNGQISDQIGLTLSNDSASTALASVSIRYSHYTDGTVADNMIGLKLTVNLSSLSFEADGSLTAYSRSALETTIVHEMMHAFMDDTLTNGMIGATSGRLDSSNQFPTWFKEGMAQAAAGGCSNKNDWVNGGLRIKSTSTTEDIKNAVTSSANKLSSGSTSANYGTGYLASMYLAYLAAGSPSNINNSNLASGLNKVLQSLMDGGSLDSVISDISGGTYTSINDFQNKFGDDASSKFISDLLVAVGDTGNGGLVNSSGSLSSPDSLPDGNANSSYYKIDTGSEFAASSVGTNRNWGSGGSTKDGTGGGSTGGGGTGGGGTGTVTDFGPLNLQVGNLAGQIVAISIEDAHADALGLDFLSVLSHDDAGITISACDEAISRISANRSRIGAYVNRLEHTIRNVDNASENTQAAESLLRDADMADEMVKYSKDSILLQAGQSMITQASHINDSIVNLLQ